MPTLRELIKVIGALFVGGLAGSAVFGAATMFVTLTHAGGTPQTSFVPSNMAWSLFFAIFTVPVSLAVGLPLFYILRRFNALSWVSVAFVGVTASLISAPLLGLHRNPTFEGLALFGGAGFIAGIAAYAVMLRSNISLNHDARREQPRAG